MIAPGEKVTVDPPVGVPTTPPSEVMVPVDVGLTVIVALPDFDPDIAVTCAGAPTATAVTRPDVETVATAALSLVQAMDRPVKTLFPASRRVAVS